MKKTTRILAVAVICISISLLLASFGCEGGDGVINTNTNTGSGTNTNTSSGTGNPGDAVVMDMTWGTLFDATQSWIDAKANTIKNEFAAALWKATEGQMYLKSQTFTNQNSSAKVRFVNPDSWSMATVGSSAAADCTIGGGTYYIRMSGLAASDAFLHEFCHGQFKKYGEAYECMICVMRQTYPETTQLSYYCNGSDCQASGTFSKCWDNYILKAYSSWTNTGANPGAAPSCTVTITY